VDGPAQQPDRRGIAIMELNPFDIGVFLAFIAVVVAVSMYKSRRERTSEDYFLAGRGLTWPLIGLSIVAANISTEQFVGMAGQSAGSTGLAVSNWQLSGSIGIVLIAFTLLPRFLRAGIYTMPEYLEYRYNSAARALMALTTVVIYVVVLLTAVLYSGGLTLHKLFDTMSLTRAVWLIGSIAAIYTVWGGLKAVAWADLIQGGALLLGGVVTFFLGMDACGGWEHFSAVNADRLHMILPADHEALPWTGVFSGLWIVIIYYCGLNQFIVQRNLAARTLRDGQLGVIFAGALWLLVPFAIVIPGIVAHQLYGEYMTSPDEAFPLLIRNLIPAGLRGFMFAAIAGAVISSLASMLNSASTIFTMDVYRRMLDRNAPEKRLLLLGRVTTALFVIAGCLLAPRLADPKFGGVFQYIQQFQGYIWPGVVAAFLFGMVVPRAPGPAAVAALLAGPILYGLFQRYATGLHFLIQVFVTFVLVVAIMGLITWLKPLATPRVLPVREGVEVRTTPGVKAAAALVLAAVAVFYVIFW
jgi:SSS family solute:Na+ symporter